MKLLLVRNIFTDIATLGDLYIDDKWFCRTLEDFDRDLFQKDALDKIKATKIAGQTCIPRGVYDVQITLSNRFKKLMPQIMNVPGFEGIRIHAGNTDKDTEGCLLLGKTSGYDFIGQSQLAFNEFYPLLKSALDHGPCTIEIVKFQALKKIFV